MMTKNVRSQIPGTAPASPIKTKNVFSSVFRTVRKFGRKPRQTKGKTTQRNATDGKNPFTSAECWILRWYGNGGKTFGEKAAVACIFDEENVCVVHGRT
jgi:hypothetical protein